MNFEQALEKYGLSIMLRKPNVAVCITSTKMFQYTWGYAEPEEEYYARFRLAMKAHSLVMRYLEQHEAPFRELGYRYYDILKMACEEYGEDYKELFAEYESILEARLATKGD